MDFDFGCDWILIQIFYAHRFFGGDTEACNQHSWHHTRHIQICKLLLIVRWSTRAWFLYVWDLLQLLEKWRLFISRRLTAYQDPSWSVRLSTLHTLTKLREKHYKDVMSGHVKKLSRLMHKTVDVVDLNQLSRSKLIWVGINSNSIRLMWSTASESGLSLACQARLRT